MRASWLELVHVRCYARLELEPAPGLNVLVGPNGSGKTTVLEALAYVSFMRSFRGGPDLALIQEGAERAVIRAGFVTDTGEKRIEVEIPRGGRRAVRLNDKRPKRLRELAAEVPVVAFLPDDLDLVKRGPGVRRTYVDELAAAWSPMQAADLDDYDAAVRQRNALLRDHGAEVDRTALEVWDDAITATGSRVLAARLAMMDRLRPAIAEALERVGETLAVRWEYRSSWLEERPSVREHPPEAFAAALGAALISRRPRDLGQRTTTAGPHRDEPALMLGDREARTQASQGEQRSLALALRLAAHRVLHERHGHAPVLLLDDVFSELDPDRAAAVIELLPRGQVLVTTAREDEVPLSGTTWLVGGGSVTESAAPQRHVPRPDDESSHDGTAPDRSDLAAGSPAGDASPTRIHRDGSSDDDA